MQKGLLFFLILVYLPGCVVQFTPEIKDKQELLVVQGLITDQNETYRIKISKSLPFGTEGESQPMTGCYVRISDDFGNTYILNENKPGLYITDSTMFRGETGRTYTLRVVTDKTNGSLTYESTPLEMRPVPPIDSVYYEKYVIKEGYGDFGKVDGCRIYLDTHDPSNKCRFYRWDFSESWILRLLFDVPNQTCWISDTSKGINIASSAAIEQDRINRYSVTDIDNTTDRLSREYSINVNQYSLNEDEYIFWENLQKITENAGGLYDIIPSSIQGNMRCIENPTEKVLGYFSVSARSSKRIFIKEDFLGIIYRYADCITDTVYGDFDIPGIGVSVWTLFNDPPSGTSPRIRILTDKRGCADCTVRGTTTKPLFWHD